MWDLVYEEKVGYDRVPIFTAAGTADRDACFAFWLQMAGLTYIQAQQMIAGVYVWCVVLNLSLNCMLVLFMLLLLAFLTQSMTLDGAEEAVDDRCVPMDLNHTHPT